jgi:hypothetical protein
VSRKGHHPDKDGHCQVQVPKPDVVITSFEALVSDATALKALSWDFVAVDERTRMLSALSRTYQAVYGIHCRARAIVAHSSLLKTVRTEHVAQSSGLLVMGPLHANFSGAKGELSCHCHLRSFV